MREVFEVPELVRVAVEDERTGVGFYSALAESAKTAEFKTLWAGLADQEKYHLERFGKMLDEMGDHAPK
ncbi:MAG TPA: ferritin family protein, partial [Phycisphaerae bacterium]|nr:ferritin family protein [Phycisphaerae bacterium]